MSRRLTRAASVCVLSGALFLLAAVPAHAQVFGISSPMPTIMVGETFALTPILRDAAGNQIPTSDWVWTALDPAVLTIDSQGRATGVSIGVGRIQLTSASKAIGLFGAVQLEVQPKSVSVSPGAKTMLAGDTAHFSAVALDVKDRPIPGVLFVWFLTAEDGRSNLIPSTTAIDSAGNLTAADTGHYTVHASIDFLPVRQGLPSHVEALAEVDVVLAPAYRIDTLFSSDPVTAKTLQPSPGVFVGSEAGQFAFTASADGYSTAVVYMDGAKTDAVASTGTPSPQPGGVVAGFQSVAMNSKGEALIAIKAGDRTDGALLAKDAAGSRFVLLDTATGSEADGKPDFELTFLSITPYCLNDNGTAVIKALYRPQDGTGADVRDGLFLMRKALSTQSVPLLLWSADQSLPSVPAVGNPPRLAFPFDNTETVPGWAGFKGLGIDNSETVYFIASSSGGRALFQMTANSAPQKILAQGDAFLGSAVKAIEDLIVTPAGDVSIRADLNNGDPHLVLFRQGKYVSDLKTLGGNPRPLAMSEAGILFTGSPATGKPDGLYMWDFKTVNTILALSAGVTSVSTATMDSKGKIVAVVRNSASGFTVLRPGGATLLTAGAAVGLTVAADLKYLVKSSRAALPSVVLSDPGNLFDLDGAGHAVPKATAGLSLNATTFFEGADNFVEETSGAQYYVTASGLYRVSNGAVTQLLAPNAKTTAGLAGSTTISPFRPLAALNGLVVVDCFTNAPDGHRALFRLQNGALTLLAINYPSPGSARLPNGWAEVAIDDSLNVYAIATYPDTSRDLVRFLSGGASTAIASTTSSSLDGETIAGIDHLRAGGNNLYVRVALTADFVRAAEARFSAASGLVSLVKSGVHLPDGTTAGDMRLTDANRNGETVFTATGSSTGTQLLGFRGADGTVRLVASNNRALPTGDYLERFADVNIRDDGTIYFLGFDVNDRAIVFRARPTNYAPSFDAASVLGAADFRAGSVAPGAWFVIYGDNFGQQGLWTSATTMTVGGASVTVCGTPAVVYYNSGPIVVNGKLTWQINVLMPDAAAGNTSCPVIVTVNGKVSATVNIPVVNNSLQLFPFTSGGASLPVVTHLNYSLVGPAAGGLVPAKPGESLIGWGTGNCAAPKITVAGSGAQVQFSGRVAPGLCQINFVVPAGVSGVAAMALSSSPNAYTLWVE